MPEPFSKNSSDYIILYPLAHKYASLCKNIHPNTITTFNLFISIFIVYLLYFYLNKPNKNIKNIIIILMLLRVFLDALDGVVARKFNKCSKFGQYLDCTTDSIYLYSLAFLFLYHKNYLVFFSLLSIEFIPFITKHQFVHDNSLFITVLFLLYFYIYN
jgi:phosphatidylglycerophosphate synthase